MSTGAETGTGPDKPDREWAKHVWQVVRDIPEGHVLTYGDVARLSGNPRWARRVGQAMHWAPRAMELPWHRVINAQGRISFPKDSPAYQRQKDRLEDEGVVFVKGRVDLARYGYQGALDKIFWADPE